MASFPTPLERSMLYSSLVMEPSNSMPLDAMFCAWCGEQHIDCTCNDQTYGEVKALPIYERNCK